MLRECDLGHGNPKCTGNSTGYDGINLIYAAGHCHAPDCISMELFNADTGKLLCRMDPVWGKSDKVQSKSLNVYDFGMQMFTSQPITALLGRKAELPFSEGCTFSCQNRSCSGTLTVDDK